MFAGTDTSKFPNLYPQTFGDPRNRVLVFVHGWPDLPRLWYPIIDKLKNDYFCVTVELPNYNKNRMQNKWGYDIVTVADALSYTVHENILKEHKDSKVTLICHDWGSIIGLVANKRSPHLYNRIACVDVGDGGELAQWSLSSKLFLVGYQWFNVLAHFSPSFVGNFMTRWMAKTFETPLAKNGNIDEIHSGMNYLYWDIWKRVFTGNTKEISIKNEFPSVPTFFVHGKKNPLKFFTNTFRDFLNETPDCEFKEYENAGHWVMVDDSEGFCAHLKKWLSDTNEKISYSKL